MEFTCKQLESDIAAIDISGPLTRGSKGEELEWELDRLIKDGSRKILIDMSASSYMDSAGLGILVGATGKMNEAGGRLRLAGINDKVLNVIRMTKLDKVLAIDENVEASLTVLGAA